MKTKGIDYCYPSSTLATKLGHGKTGCWVVKIDPMEMKYTLHHATPNEAEAYRVAATLPMPWHPMWAKCDAKRIAKHAK